MQAEVEKAAGGRDSIQAYSERGKAAGRRMPAHPSKSWTATCAAADGFQESGWQAAGPEEDEVAVVVAFPVSKDPRPLAQLAETSIAMPIANSQRPWMMDRSIDRRQVPFHREVASTTLCVRQCCGHTSYRLGTIHLCIYRCSCLSRIIRSVVRIKKDIRSMIRVS